MILLKFWFVKNKFRLKLLCSALSKGHMYGVQLAFRAQADEDCRQSQYYLFLDQLRLSVKLHLSCPDWMGRFFHERDD